MHSISNDMRRATRDIDLDFIKYSLDNESIIKFINKLNDNNDNIIIEIQGDIEKLHHQDYDGKRVNIKVIDKYGNYILSKLDIGVHKNFDILQEEYCFNLNLIDSSAKLLINSKEQIFIEKLKSLLKFGIISTRYKDIFDFYYLITFSKINKNIFLIYLNEIIFKDVQMPENNIKDIINKLEIIFSNSKFKKNLNDAKNNWIEMPVEVVIDTIINFFKKF